MKEIVEIEYASEGLLTYQKDILCSGLCGLFLPVNMIEEGSRVTGVYDRTGYVCLADVDKVSVCRALDMMIELLNQIIRAEGRYFFQGDYIISPEAVYVRYDEEKVKLVFIPAASNDPKEIVKAGLIEVAEFLMTATESHDQKYMEKVLHYLERGKSSVGILKHRVEELRREATACGFS